MYYYSICMMEAPLFIYYVDDRSKQNRLNVINCEMSPTSFVIEALGAWLNNERIDGQRKEESDTQHGTYQKSSNVATEMCHTFKTYNSK